MPNAGDCTPRMQPSKPTALPACSCTKARSQWRRLCSNKRPRHHQHEAMPPMQSAALCRENSQQSPASLMSNAAARKPEKITKSLIANRTEGPKPCQVRFGAPGRSDHMTALLAQIKVDDGCGHSSGSCEQIHTSHSTPRTAQQVGPAIK